MLYYLTAVAENYNPLLSLCNSRYYGWYIRHADYTFVYPGIKSSTITF